MNEQPDFTPEQSALHKFWLDQWHAKFHEGPYTPDDVAQTMFHVAFAVWLSRHKTSRESAHQLYMLALRQMAKAVEAGEVVEVVKPADASTH